MFKGELGLEFVNTKKHPPLNFDFQGWLELPDDKKLIKGKGELHHIGDSDQIACMLGLVINLNLSELNIDLPAEFGDIRDEITYAISIAGRDLTDTKLSLSIALLKYADKIEIKKWLETGERLKYPDLPEKLKTILSLYFL